MSLTIVADPVPIAVDDHGVARVGGSRVTLDTVVLAFQSGAGPDEIVRRYDTLAPADVYGTIAYYLRHRSEIDAYLRERKLQKAEVRRLADSGLDRQAIRERLLTRAAQRPR